MIDNPGQVVRDSEKEVVQKKNKCMAKRKERLKKLHTPIGSLSSPHPKSSSFLIPHPLPTLISALVLAPMLTPMFAPMPGLISRPRSPAVLSSRYIPTQAKFVTHFLLCPAPSSCLRSSPLLFFHSVPVPVISRCGILTHLLPFLVLGLSLLLESSSFRTFKQFLSNEP